MIEELTRDLERKIVTVTMNPVFDKSLFIRGFEPGGTFIAEESTTLAAGKGVNVSRALKNVSIDSIATGILPEGGMDAYLELLEHEGISHDFVHTQGAIRTNVTLVNTIGCDETHIRERGPLIGSLSLKLLQKKIISLIEDETVFVFSGSLPEGLPSTAYAGLIETLKRYGCPSFLDTSEDALRDTVSSGPFFVKPNLEEAEQVLGYYPEKADDLKKACEDFHEKGVENVMITMGKKGVVFSGKGELVRASVEIPFPVNSVGSGDAALAGSIVGILGGLDAKSIARLACTFGAANSLISGAGRFQYGDLERLYGMAETSALL